VIQFSQNRQPFALVFAFALVCVLSALALIYTKHERDQLNIEWGQLQIEQSTWATHARIEQVATDDLSLVRPAATEIYVIERP
jgi:cell division protein FtsL